MLPGMEMLACPNLAVSPEVMQHIVHVESSANPYAIGVVGGQLQRQPRDLAEALATVKMLDARGYNFSLGLAQVNRANLGRYGLDSYEQAFNVCDNLSAASQILADCHASAQGDWSKAFSCYYSGNFTTGFRDGYVQKIYASINREARGSATTSGPPTVESIALRPQAMTGKAANTPMRTIELEPVTVHASSGANYRVALRSQMIDTMAEATVDAMLISGIQPGKISTSSTAGDEPDSTAAPAYAAAVESAESIGHVAGQLNSAVPSLAPVSGIEQNSNDHSVFVPEVHGPNDPPNLSKAAVDTAVAKTFTRDAVDQDPDIHQVQQDAAFVF